MLDQHNAATPPEWMKRVLQLAAIYNLAWGSVVIAAPLLLFRWAGMEDPRYPQIWQCVGMIVGVYGIGYWLAAKDPFRHWPIVFVGLLGKVLGPIGFLQAASSGDLPWAWGVTIITNDLIWWAPFAAILYRSFRANSDSSRGIPPKRFSQAISEFRSHRNATLLEISSKFPTLVVFLRHGGCTFCRETLSELRRYRREIEGSGTEIAIVHMGNPMDGTLMLQKYGLDGVHRFSDPECVLYRAFGLARGNFKQLFSPKTVSHGIRALMRGHGIGRLQGDGFRMPGTFTLIRGNIIEVHRSNSAEDTPNYADMAKRSAQIWRQNRIGRPEVLSESLMSVVYS